MLPSGSFSPHSEHSVRPPGDAAAPAVQPARLSKSRAFLLLTNETVCAKSTSELPPCTGFVLCLKCDANHWRSGEPFVRKAPKGFEVRPTPDHPGQTLLNSLGPRVTNARVLELFAGSGALGFECLSRGASEVVSVEKASRHARMIRENLEAVGLDATRFHLRVQDTSRPSPNFSAEQRVFDLVFADPPFGEKNVGRRSTSFSQKLLDNEMLPSLLGASGMLILGHSKRDQLSNAPHWVERKLLKHGDSIFRFFEAAPHLSPPGQDPASTIL